MSVIIVRRGGRPGPSEAVPRINALSAPAVEQARRAAICTGGCPNWVPMAESCKLLDGCIRRYRHALAAAGTGGCPKKLWEDGSIQAAAVVTR